MPVLQAHNISQVFDNGEVLFQQLSCSMSRNRVGLVGRNGIGKSIFAAILSGEQQPSSGTVTYPLSCAVYRQQPAHLLSGGLSIAQFLGKNDVLKALKQIESGDCSAHWLDVIGEQWDLSMRLTRQLREMGLPADPDFPCAQLSGGQLARLQLWQLFASDVELLILDEPSNHLDAHAKQWLIESIRVFEGAILLISHERLLLREMDEIWQLSGQGLHVFGGNYDVYVEHMRTEQQAVERQLVSVDKQKKKLAAQAQRNREKAAQRAAKGDKLRKAGGQPKILLDYKKDSATARTSNLHKNEQLRQAHLNEKEQALRARKEQVKRQKLYLSDNTSRLHQVVSLLEGVLSFGCRQPITLQIYANDKIHLTGKNGCGKSTLLKTLLGKFTLQQGKLHLNTSLYYLDQHFGAVQPELSMLNNLIQQCEGIKESDARTLLAGIGFRRDSVFRLGSMLSGGEKMKLAMLIVSHQPEQPMLLLDEPDNHLDLDSKIMLAQALRDYRGGFILVSHDDDFASESGIQRQVTL
ncbi:ATP-binding cassette domain-containing protein [Vibrio gazogenes]|uniref:ATPase components of ABC transporters with duplicated ATPase domains n=2 Tax=Vibrio gazogenes TaxID=687 RepID=A0A1M5F6P5_VIBGA|nr:ATP-binding cassette domain-containing protein [Vibrio gazogenes]USP15432.1 ATP-binding cassette domain-containing protein [Vibrio gazogenes]SHF87224.1 ATPase components of ABC transporters with duplicated ATPase domains [Vibrio gazogenes DSM 21264] [Vibrio gazogenes DSM 21264 = NBRC 103151]